MAESNPNPELEKFRRQWKKELHNKSKHSDSADTSGPSTSKESAVDGMETPTHKLNHISDYSLRPIGTDHPLVPLQDDNSCDGFEVNTLKPRFEGSTLETATEYFPFKILTQFLNEAPKRMESKQTKAALKSPPVTLSKKRYFQELKVETPKRVKEEVSTDDKTAEKETSEPKEESKQMLDLFIADLVSCALSFL